MVMGSSSLAVKIGLLLAILIAITPLLLWISAFIEDKDLRFLEGLSKLINKYVDKVELMLALLVLVGFFIGLKLPSDYLSSDAHIKLLTLVIATSFLVFVSPEMGVPTIKYSYFMSATFTKFLAAIVTSVYYFISAVVLLVVSATLVALVRDSLSQF